MIRVTRSSLSISNKFPTVRISGMSRIGQECFSLTKATSALLTLHVWKKAPMLSFGVSFFLSIYIVNSFVIASGCNPFRNYLMIPSKYISASRTNVQHHSLLQGIFSRQNEK